MIFKIQTLKSQLIGIGQSISDKGDYLIRHTTVIFSKKANNTQFLFALERALKKNDINELKFSIDLIDDKLEEGDIEEILHFKLYRENYCEAFDNLQSLVKSTINWSIFTAVIIILCLGTIPFGDLILQHIYILYALFTLVIVGIVLCFWSLISTLKKALSDSRF